MTNRNDNEVRALYSSRVLEPNEEVCRREREAVRPLLTSEEGEYPAVMTKKRQLGPRASWRHYTSASQPKPPCGVW